MSWWRMATNGQRIPTPLGMSRSVFMAGTMTGTWNWRVGKEPWSKTYKRRSEYANTLVTELDLVCDYAQWPHISTSLFYVGSLLGNIIFGNIADRFTKLQILLYPRILKYEYVVNTKEFQYLILYPLSPERTNIIELVVSCIFAISAVFSRNIYKWDQPNFLDSNHLHMTSSERCFMTKTMYS